MWDVKALYPSDPVNALHSVILSVKSKDMFFLSTSVMISFVFSHMWLLFYLNRFAGDVAELGIIRAGEHKKVQVVLRPRVHLVRMSA